MLSYVIDLTPVQSTSVSVPSRRRCLRRVRSATTSVHCPSAGFALRHTSIFTIVSILWQRGSPTTVGELHADSCPAVSRRTFILAAYVYMSTVSSHVCHLRCMLAVRQITLFL